MGGFDTLQNLGYTLQINVKPRTPVCLQASVCEKNKQQTPRLGVSCSYGGILRHVAMLLGFGYLGPPVERLE